jgi:hypothetical protein
MSSLVKGAQSTEDRIERAMRIYDSGLVKQISPGTFVVASESNQTAYYIVNQHGCTCPDSMERRMLCKHIWACFISAVLTIWRIQLAETWKEVEEIADYYLPTPHMPTGIHRTIQLEQKMAIERLTA